MRLLFTAFVLVTTMASSAVSEVAREIVWDNLIPSFPPLEIPFADLSDDQIFDLETIAVIRGVLSQGMKDEVSSDGELLIELTHRLKNQGFDVESLLSQYDAFMAEIEKRGKAVIDDLDNQLVRIPGYALPLEYSKSGVTEFLLVPNVGACIHVPPPPANQTLFVHLDKSFKSDDLFTPVWVTGRLKVNETSKELSFVDGQADVVVGYTLESAKVELYEK